MYLLQKLALTQKLIVTLFTSMLLVLSHSSFVSAAAETTGWISDKNIKAYMDKLGKQGRYPTKMKCTGDGGKTDSSIMHIKMKVTHKKQTKKGVSWTWGIQTNTYKAERELKAQGYVLASKSSVHSPNGGFVVKCVVFHK